MRFVTRAAVVSEPSTGPPRRIRSPGVEELRPPFEDDRWVTPIFALLLAAGAVAFIWAGSGMTFFNYDDFVQFASFSWSPTTFIAPLNGHLILFSRLLFHVVATAFGPEYWILRVLGIAGIVVMDGLFFALMRRRVGPSIALAATIPVLFLGSAWEALIWPTATLELVYAIAAGLGAFLALEEDGRRRDLVACGLLILSLASFTIGVCFAAGVAVAVLRRSDRWRRAWIFVVPLTLWGAWWLWSLRFGGTGIVLSNLPHLPIYYWRSIAAISASLSGQIGVNVPSVSFNIAPPQNLNYGSLLALAGVAVFVLLLVRRRSIPPTVWPFAVTILTYWTLTGLAFDRGANASRYMLAGVLMLLLVVAEMAREIRVGHLGLGAVYVAAGVMAVLNLLILRQAHEFFFDYSANARAQFAMLELAGARARPDFVPGRVTPAASTQWLLISAADYRKAVAHYGSPADTLAQLQGSSDPTRARADAVLVAALALEARAVPAPASPRGCAVVTGQSSGPTTVRLPPGGAILRTDHPSALLLGRFARAPTIGTGLIGGSWVQLAIPVDRAARPWLMTALNAGRVNVCPIAA